MIPVYFISTDRSKIGLPLVYEYLSTESYWSKNIPLELVKTSIRKFFLFQYFPCGRTSGFCRSDH